MSNKQRRTLAAKQSQPLVPPPVGTPVILRNPEGQITAELSVQTNLETELGRKTFECAQLRDSLDKLGRMYQELRLAHASCPKSK